MSRSGIWRSYAPEKSILTHQFKLTNWRGYESKVANNWYFRQRTVGGVGVNEPQARAILEQVQRDYPGIIQASLEHNPKAKSGAVRVGLLLTTAHRRVSLRYPSQ